MDIFCELLIPVFFRVPMEQRIVKRDPEYMLRIVGVFDDEQLSLYDRTHPFTRLFLVFRLDGGDGRHEDPVHMHVRETADMSVDELRREADRIGGNRGKSRLIELVAARGTRTVKPRERKNVDQNGMVSQKERTRGIPITRFLEVTCSGTG